MYSCGSLAPKMRRGGGCADHLFRRPAEPWEKADGWVEFINIFLYTCFNGPPHLDKFNYHQSCFKSPFSTKSLWFLVTILP